MARPLFLLLLATILLPGCRREPRERFEHTVGPYTVTITDPGFTLEIRRGDRVVLPARPNDGLHFLGSPAREVVEEERSDTTTRYRVTNREGQSARVDLILDTSHLELRIRLEDETQSGQILFPCASPGAAFGLADHGSYGESSNLAGSPTTHRLAHDGGNHRFLSSFLVFPGAGVAGMTFDRGGGIVEIGPDRWVMGNENSRDLTVHYFVGTIPEIYSVARKTRIAAGYPGVAPKPLAFEVGWESWDALGWKTRGDTVQEHLQRFLDEGYPIRWAVTGSGFWRPQGSTVHFGEFDREKYPDRDDNGITDLLEWMNERNIRWIAGQRTSFVVPGGPHRSQRGQSGATLFDTSPDTADALERNYLLEDDPGHPVRRVSPYFPTVPCHVLDGNRTGAADWFAGRWQEWKFEGVKEDTMLALPDHTVFNAPMRAVANSGALVIARCGSYSSPGTLTRINDTHGPANMRRRAPINYLQYAASGAPNLYSDTIGMAHMHQPRASLRHAWFTALAAGMAVGVGPWEWAAHHRATYRKVVDFHHALAPYQYSCAVDSHADGYPHTLTPLPLAYPDDPMTYDLAAAGKFQWMIGPSLLATPLLHAPGRDHLDLYLPAGKWIHFETGEVFHGPLTVRDYPLPLDRIPVFVGGRGIFVLRPRDGAPLQAVIFPIKAGGDAYRFHWPDGSAPSTVATRNTGWKADALFVIDPDSNRRIPHSSSSTTGAIRFHLEPGRRYELRGGD